MVLRIFNISLSLVTEIFSRTIGNVITIKPRQCTKQNITKPTFDRMDDILKMIIKTEDGSITFMGEVEMTMLVYTEACNAYKEHSVSIRTNFW